MSDVFLSYASEDTAIAQRVAEGLESYGFSVWLDHDIPAGASFNEVIGEALEEAKAVVVLWSSSSVESNWVRAETGVARAQDKLISAVLDDVRMPMTFRRIQSVNLRGWRGDQHDPAFRLLLEAISKLVVPAGADAERHLIESQPTPAGEFVVVSYSAEDSEWVEDLVDFLGDQGVATWVDKDIESGDRWWKTIVENIKLCSGLLVVMTQASDESKWVERELLYADELEKPLFPLLLSGTRFPLLVGTQYEDVSDRSMPDNSFVERLRRELIPRA